MKAALHYFLFAFFLLSCNNITNRKSDSAEASVSKTFGHTQVIQFHSTHRCISCRTIEKLSKEVLIETPAISFKLVNVDSSQNEEMAARFGAAGTALFLYDSITNKKKDLTEFAFMTARTKPDEFKRGLKREIENF